MTTYLSTPSFYTILINNVSGYPETAPNDGFIDKNTVEDYARMNNLNLETGIVGFTLAQSEAKSRANARYHNLLLQLNRVCNIVVDEGRYQDSLGYMSHIVYTGSPNYNTEPASIQFKVMVDRGDSSLQTWDELNPTVLLTGTAALTRFVVRALASPPGVPLSTPATDVSLNATVYDPTATESPGNTNSLPRYGRRIELLDVGPVVFGGSTAANYTAAAGMVTITQPFVVPVS
jgi:hypothetical protein